MCVWSRQRESPPLLLVLLLAMLCCGTVAAVPALAQTPGGAVAGVVTGLDGTPVDDAAVSLTGNGLERTVRTDARGRFALAGVPYGTYGIAVRARAYDPVLGRVVDVRDAQTRLALELVRSSSSLVTIGRVATSSGQTVSTASAPSQELSAQAASARGESSVAELVARGAISATVIHPAGANPAGPLVVALRGPDPTETLVDIDGHATNSGGTGAFDLSLLDPAGLSSVQLVYGIAPSSLVGPNTIGGAINVRTLEPTSQPHGLLRFTAGSFGAFGEALQATGSEKRLGYAFSLHRATTQGEVANQRITAADGSTPTVGSSVSGDTALAKLRYTFGRGDAFAALTVRDQSAFRDLSAALTSVVTPGASATPPPTGDQNVLRRTLRALPRDASDVGVPSSTYNSFAGSSLAAHNAGYGLDLQLPIGAASADGFARTTMLFRHETSFAGQSVTGAAAGSSLYLYNDRDVLGDDSLEIDRVLPSGALSLKLAVRNERLDTQQIVAGSGAQPLPGLGQTQRSAVLRYAFDPTAKLHYTFAVYESSFSSFGTSVDPRFGFVWTPTARSALRFSAGSTFQSPQLPELSVPRVLPPPDAAGYIDIGNPGLKADHATEFDLGFEHIFLGRNVTRAAVDVYRTNLRTPSQRYLPPVTCLGSDAPAPAACESFPINVGGAVYQGVELRLEHALARSIVASAAYSINSNAPTSVSPAFQNGTIVPREQFQGSPLHRGTLTVESAPAAGLGYRVGVAYEDGYNGLNRPAYATVQGGLTWHVPAGFEVGVYGTNLTNVYADRFTRAGAGVPYGGIAGPIPTDAYALQGRAFTFAVTRRY